MSVFVWFCWWQKGRHVMQGHFYTNTMTPRSWRHLTFHNVVHSPIADGRVAGFNVHKRLVSNSHRNHLLHSQLWKEKRTDVRHETTDSLSGRLRCEKRSPRLRKACLHRIFPITAVHTAFTSPEQAWRMKVSWDFRRRNQISNLSPLLPTFSVIPISAVCRDTSH